MSNLPGSAAAHEIYWYEWKKRENYTITAQCSSLLPRRRILSLKTKLDFKSVYKKLVTVLRVFSEEQAGPWSHHSVISHMKFITVGVSDSLMKDIFTIPGGTHWQIVTIHNNIIAICNEKCKNIGVFWGILYVFYFTTLQCEKKKSD